MKYAGLVLILPLFAQLPGDPAAILAQAAQRNGLTGDDIKPWHLRLQYEIVAANRPTKDTGTYEEFWISPTRYRRTYTNSEGALTEFGTARGVFRSGRADSVDLLKRRIRGLVVHPLPTGVAAL